MNVLILGSTGGTGRALIEQALGQGHTVTAFARDPSKVRTTHARLRTLKGNILDSASLEAAMPGQDAVLSALGVGIPVLPVVAIVLLCQVAARLGHLGGPAGLLVRIGIPFLAYLFLFRRKTTLSDGTRNVVEAMEKAGVKRFICESSLGVGNSKGQLGLFYSYILLPILLRNVFADKEVQEKIIAASNLDWVIVRPGALTNGPRTGIYHSGFDSSDRSIQARISRADVADFMLQQLTTDVYLRKTPGVSY